MVLGEPLRAFPGLRALGGFRANPRELNSKSLCLDHPAALVQWGSLLKGKHQKHFLNLKGDLKSPRASPRRGSPWGSQYIQVAFFLSFLSLRPAYHIKPQVLESLN